MAPRAASADWFVVPSVGMSFGADTTLIDLEFPSGDLENKLSLQAGVLWQGDGWLGIDGEVGYISGFFERHDDNSPENLVRSGVLTAFGSVVITVPRRVTGYSLRPFAVGGFGLIRATSDDVIGVFPVRANLMGLRIGGGALGMLTETVGVRFEFCHIGTLKGQGNEGEAFGSRSLGFWRLSAGAVLRF